MSEVDSHYCSPTDYDGRINITHKALVDYLVGNDEKKMKKDEKM